VSVDGERAAHALELVSTPASASSETSEIPRTTERAAFVHARPARGAELVFDSMIGSSPRSVVCAARRAASPQRVAVRGMRIHDHVSAVAGRFMTSMS
jgi:hypothetical protein